MSEGASLLTGGVKGSGTKHDGVGGATMMIVCCLRGIYLLKSGAETDFEMFVNELIDG